MSRSNTLTPATSRTSIRITQPTHPTQLLLNTLSTDQVKQSLLYIGVATLLSAAGYTLYEVYRRKSTIPRFTFTLTTQTRQLFLNYFNHFNHQQHLTDDELIRRIRSAYYAAAAHHPYKYVLEKRFVESRICFHPRYVDFIVNHPQRSTLKVLDVGCCMGTDVRQLMLDGVKRENVMGVDISAEFQRIGCELFNDVAVMRERFVAMDVLQPSFKKQAPASFKRFVGSDGVDVIYCGSLYHLLSEQQCTQLTRSVVQVLKRGSGIFFGRTVGSTIDEPIRIQDSQLRQLHSKATLIKLLQSHGFVDVQVNETQVDMQDGKLSPKAEQQLQKQGDGKATMLCFSGRLSEAAVLSPRTHSMTNPRSPSARPIIPF